MVAANGARLSKKDHPTLPLEKEQIVQTALACKKAGAQALHLHVRDDNFKHVLDLKRYDETIKAIKNVCSDDFIVQATTEAVGVYKPEDMIQLIKSLKPQATSVAIKELLPSKDDKKELKAAKDFYHFAKEENIGIQHILYSSDELKRFYDLLQKGVICGDKHSILFVLGRYTKDQQSDPLSLISYLKTLKELNLEDKVNWMLCAFGKKEIPSLITAGVLGGNCRIGFENSRVLPTGEIAKDNQSQVKYLRKIFDLLNIKKVTKEHMREVLGIFK